MPDINPIVHKPDVVSALGTNLIQERIANPNIGVPIYIPSVDQVWPRMRPTELITIIARPGNMKTSIMQWVARNEAAYIEQHNLNTYVAYFTWEQAVEEMALYELAAMSGENVDALAQGYVASPETVLGCAIRRATLPLWVFGHSIANRSRRPRISLSDAHAALRWVEDTKVWGNLRPSLICIDYLQRIRPEQGRDVFEQTSINVDKLKDMALEFTCPVLLGCQAKRDVDDREIKLPNMGDGMLTSNIEHSSDGILTSWYVKTGMLLGSRLPGKLGLGEIEVSDNLMLISGAKRKLARAGWIKPVHVVPARNQFGDWR